MKKTKGIPESKRISKAKKDIKENEIVCAGLYVLTKQCLTKDQKEKS